MTQLAPQKHLGMFLNTKLDFQKQLKNILITVNKTIVLLHEVYQNFSVSHLLTICKSFIRPHLDYGDIISDQKYSALFHQKLESIQYKSALAIQPL